MGVTVSMAVLAIRCRAVLVGGQAEAKAEMRPLTEVVGAVAGTLAHLEVQRL